MRDDLRVYFSVLKECGGWNHLFSVCYRPVRFFPSKFDPLSVVRTGRVVVMEFVSGKLRLQRPLEINE